MRIGLSKEEIANRDEKIEEKEGLQFKSSAQGGHAAWRWGHIEDGFQLSRIFH